MFCTSSSFTDTRAEFRLSGGRTYCGRQEEQAPFKPAFGKDKKELLDEFETV